MFQYYYRIIPRLEIGGFSLCSCRLLAAAKTKSTAAALYIARCHPNHGHRALARSLASSQLVNWLSPLASNIIFPLLPNCPVNIRPPHSLVITRLVHSDATMCGGVKTRNSEGVQALAVKVLNGWCEARAFLLWTTAKLGHLRLIR